MDEMTRLVSEQLTELEAEYGERLEAVSVAAWLRPQEEGGTADVLLHYVARPGHQDRLGWIPVAVTVPPPEQQSGSPQEPRDD